MPAASASVVARSRYVCVCVCGWVCVLVWSGARVWDDETTKLRRVKSDSDRDAWSIRSAVRAHCWDPVGAAVLRCACPTTVQLLRPSPIPPHLTSGGPPCCTGERTRLAEGSVVRYCGGRDQSPPQVQAAREAPPPSSPPPAVLQAAAKRMMHKTIRVDSPTRSPD